MIQYPVSQSHYAIFNKRPISQLNSWLVGVKITVLAEDEVPSALYKWLFAPYDVFDVQKP